MSPLKATWGLGLLALLLFAALALFLAPLQPSVLALQFAFTPRAFGEVVHSWTPAMRERFVLHLPLDMVLLVAYGAFGYLLARRQRAMAAARWLLPLAALADAVENGLHAWLVAAPRLGIVWPYGLAATAASLKWLLLLAFVLCAVRVFARGRR